MKRHDLRPFIVRRNLRMGLLSWCHRAAALGNPELSVTGTHHAELGLDPIF
jgi:hypothetical protein